MVARDLLPYLKTPHRRALTIEDTNPHWADLNCSIGAGGCVDPRVRGDDRKKRRIGLMLSLLGTARRAGQLHLAPALALLRGPNRRQAARRGGGAAAGHPRPAAAARRSRPVVRSASARPARCVRALRAGCGQRRLRARCAAILAPGAPPSRRARPPAPLPWPGTKFGGVSPGSSTGAPSFTRSAPSMTMRSPFCSPCSTAIRSPLVTPSVTAAR